jgi:hypothetical protein
MRVVALAGEGGKAAVRLAARLGECTAIFVGAGAPAAAAALQQAHADGAVELIHLWDGALAEMEREGMTRELMLSAILATFGRRLEARLFVVPDIASGWLGPALAEELDVPHLTAVLAAELLPDDAQADAASSSRSSPLLPELMVRRRCHRGIQRLRGPAIGVLCVLPQPDGKPNAPPPPKNQVEIQRWDLARLGLGPVDLPRSLLRPVLPERHSEITGRNFDNLAALAERMRQDGLVPTGGES